MPPENEWLIVVDMQRAFVDSPSPWAAPDFYKALARLDVNDKDRDTQKRTIASGDFGVGSPVVFGGNYAFIDRALPRPAS